MADAMTNMPNFLDLYADAEEIFSVGATTEIMRKTRQNPKDIGLSGTTPSQSGAFISKDNQDCSVIEKMSIAAHLADCDQLTGMQLRAKYRAEANSHRNMLSRQQLKDAIVHPNFKDFRNFLRIVGPIPAVGATLDRIDNSDPEYAPGKVRWADKRVQNANKGDTLTICSSITGESFTTSRLAKLQGVSSSAVRARLGRGWSHDEIIVGKRAKASDQGGRAYVQSREPAPTQYRYDQVTRHRASRKHRDGSDCSCREAYRPEMTAKQIAFDQMARLMAAEREQYPDHPEPLMPLYHEANEMFDLHEESQWLPYAGFLAKWTKEWPSFRPHVIFERLSAGQIELIEQVDPGWLREKRAQQRLKERLKEQL